MLNEENIDLTDQSGGSGWQLRIVWLARRLMIGIAIAPHREGSQHSGLPSDLLPLTKLTLHHGPLHFSNRHKEILALIGEGLSDQEIAHRLGLSPSTVKTYLSRLYRRYGFKNRAQAALAYAALAPASELAIER